MDADKAQITEVLIRYATGIDSKDWKLFRSCWTDEVDLDYGEVGHFTDPDAFTELFAQTHNPMGSDVSPVVELRDRGQRRHGHRADLCTRRADGHARRQRVWVDVIGHYDDELVRGADGWRIRRRVTHTPRLLTGGVAARDAADFAQKYGRWAVIAGASEGVGASLADQLAGRGLDLVLIARNGALLEELAAKVHERHGVEVRSLVQDLTAPDVGDRVAEATDGLEVGLLIYNAGAANRTVEFLDDSFERLAAADQAGVHRAGCAGPALRPRDARARPGRHRSGGITRLPGRGILCWPSTPR